MTDWMVRDDVISVVDEDGDLAADVSPRELATVRQRAVARCLRVEPRGWDPAELNASAEPGWLGLLIIDGLLLRRVRVGRRAACELFGPGDVLRPWDSDGDYTPLPITVDWLVLQSARLAVLDTAFALRVAGWPTITGRIVGRVAQRARYLALSQAVTHLPRVHSRLLILFWLLAERWGRVTPGGVYVTLPLTHEVLAMLVGAQRPTVTIALQRLTRTDCLHRERADRWLLTTTAVDILGRPDSFELIDTLPA